MTSLLQSIFKPRRTRHVALTAGSAALLALVVLVPLWLTGSMDRMEARSLDERFDRRAPLTAPDDIVVVGIDEQTATYFNQWPLSRTLYAQALEKLGAAGAKLVVFDVPFADPDLVRSRDQLAEAMESLPEWQRGAINEFDATTEDDDFITALKEHPPAVIVADPAEALSGLVGPDHPDPLAESGAHAGERGFVQDASGRVRAFQWEGSAAAAGLEALELEPAQQPGGETVLNWYGEDMPFEYASFGDVATGIAVTRSFNDKIVFIGIHNGVVDDNVGTPVGVTPAVTATATAFANAREGAFLRELSPLGAVAVTAGLALAVWILLEFVALGLAVGAVAGLAVGYGWLATHAFEQGVVLPVAWPLLAAAVVFTGTVLCLATLSVRERLRIRGLFARYVSPDVVSALVDSEDPVRLGGDEREITVLFSDIRGFTSLSESVDATEMVAQLNEYFAEMVEVVTGAEGTLDKFLGDGLMAIFGAPVNQSDHARRACHAALQMLERLDVLNARRSAQGLPALAIGIGIHTGKAVVGNVGSPLFRVDFTAIGDTVNLASRLEGLTKELGSPIVVSGETVVAAGAVDGAHFSELGSVVVKGRTAATPVHALAPGAAQLPASADRASA